MPVENLEPLAQFGLAGLMCVLWIWERRTSAKRETQLTEAHERILKDREGLSVLVQLVERNTQAVQRFDQALTSAINLLEKMRDEIVKHNP
ncbi:MAG: hypothetical protein GC164_02565 [Phycisphaera sp.]|nr:hypothetical protein [Phycisphaera sp.]